ncbi:MAG: hypothetical protein AAFX98_06395, partial [Pseudomonadota bacterium]
EMVWDLDLVAVYFDRRHVCSVPPSIMGARMLLLALAYCSDAAPDHMRARYCQPKPDNQVDL